MALPVLRSIVRQLAAPITDGEGIRKSLREARAQSINEGSQLGFRGCDEQLLESVKLYSTTLIVLDALDEMIDEELITLIDHLNDLICKTRDHSVVKLFVSSRPENNIASMFKLIPSIEINSKDNKADIQKYIEEEVDAFKKRNPESEVNEVMDQIISGILEKCDKMYASSPICGPCLPATN